MMHVRQFVRQQVSQLVSLSRSISQLVWVNQSISRSVDQSISRSVDQSISWSVDQSISQSVCQSVSQSNNQSVIKDRIKKTVEFRFSMVGIWLVWQSLYHQLVSKSISHAISHKHYWHFSHDQSICMCALILKLSFIQKLQNHAARIYCTQAMKTSYY